MKRSLKRPPRHTGAAVALVAATLAAPVRVFAADPPFRAAPDVVLPFAASLAALTAGDFDSDGHRDLAFADVSGELSIWAGRGDGTFRPGPNPQAGATVHSLAVADVDADGDEDLLAGAGDGIHILPGRGDGRFDTPRLVNLGGAARDVTTGDLNGDRRTDLAAVTQAGLKLRIQDDLGAFVPGEDLPARSGSVYQRVAIADFDGDAKPDVAASTFRPGGDGEIDVYPGTGAGTADDARSVPLPGAAAALLVGDFNADAALDLATPVATRDTLSVRLGLGDGAFSTLAPDVALGERPSDGIAMDVDRDGHEDVVSLNGTGGSVRLSNGDGTFRDGGDLAADGIPYYPVTGDFDEDGSQDVAYLTVRSVTERAIAVRLNTTPPPLGNLLVNGSFEAGSPARTSREAPEVPGWDASRAPGMTFARYGSVPVADTPGWTDAALLASGRSFLRGGIGAGTELFQDVDVSGRAAAIDAGTATVTLSALLGGARDAPDAMRARAEFDTGGAMEVGPVTTAQRRNRTTMLRRSGTAPVPAGTRRIRVVLTAAGTGTDSTALADDVRLTLDATDPGPAPAGTPTPVPTGTPGSTTTPDRTAPRISRVRVVRGRSLHFQLSEAARVRVRIRTGRRIRTLRRAGRAGANTVHLGALRRGRHRLTIRATDAAGNATTTRPRRFSR